MKLNKTESKVLNQLARSVYGMQGTGRKNAADSLVAKGLAEHIESYIVSKRTDRVTFRVTYRWNCILRITDSGRAALCN